MAAHPCFSRRNFLRTAAFGAATWALARRAPFAAAPQTKPNIVFVLADDLGYGDPRCNNPDSKVPTPHFDRLAREGVRFTDAHSGSAVCTPTRYGILTGRYCWRTSLKRGVLGGYSASLIEPGRLTVASLLKQHGYATACIGKWHLGMDWGKKGPGPVSMDGNSEENVDFSQPIQNGPTAVGFDYYFGISASLDMPPYIFIENDRLVGSPTAHQPKDGPVRAGAKAPDFTMEGVLPTLTKKAVEFIESHTAKKSGQPFFLYFSLNAPHTPVAPADFVKGKSQAGPYGDFVHQVDHSLGEVMAALDRCKIADNTLVIMTSDNGSTNKPMTEYDHLPNGHLRGRKSTIWDGGHRIPFVARWPGKIRPSTTSDETIWLGDFMATCAAIVGAELPRDAGEDSINILPALLGETRSAPLHEAIVHHSIDGMFAIRSGRWKLILGRGSGGWDGKGSPDDPPGQLYDMSADVEEKENLYTKHPEIVERLTALLKQYEETGRSRP